MLGVKTRRGVWIGSRQPLWVKTRCGVVSDTLLPVLSRVKLELNGGQRRCRWMCMRISPLSMLSISKELVRPFSLALRNRSDFCDLRLRCPSRTPEIARFPRRKKAMLHCDVRVRWKVASDLRFRAAISEPKTPSFCGISGDLAQSTRKSLAIAIVRFWCAEPFSPESKNRGMEPDRVLVASPGQRPLSH